MELKGKEEEAYLPNSGRLPGLLVPGGRVFVKKAKRAGRRTQYDMVMALVQNGLVCVDSRAANGVFCEAIQEGKLDEFHGYSVLRREASYGGSRLDFLLSRGSEKCYVEVKSVTLVEEGKALFPDAPTLRGTRHLEELVRAREEGYRAAVVFVVQRGDANRFSSNDSIDATFAKGLRRACAKGVVVHCYGCSVDSNEITICKSVPVCL
jgi:sugar fermentation stimulation protein A